MAAPEYLHGKGGRAMVGAVTLNVKEWSVEPSTDDHDVTNMESEGYEEFIFGLKHLTGRLTMVYDAANSQLDNPPNLVDGVFVALKLYMDKTGGIYWNIPKAGILGTPMIVNVGTEISFEVNFKSSGARNIVGL